MIEGRTYEVRRRRAIRIFVWTIIDPSSTTEAEQIAAARWLWQATRGGERPARRFDLRKEMTQRGISTQDLAARLGVAPGTVASWRNGKSHPTLDSAYRLADLFGLSRRRRSVALALGAKYGHIAPGPD